MNRILIRKTNVDWSPSWASHVERRLAVGLRRLGRSIVDVAVRLSDINGTRRGMDKHCRIEVQLATGRHLVVNATDECPYRAVDSAVDRLKRAARRALDKTRHRKRRGSRAGGRPPRNSTL